jgi:hypothetical protein
MKHRGHWVVVMVKQLLPILIPRRLPESIFVRGNILPSDQKKIVAFSLETSLEFVRNIAWHRCDDALRFAEREFKCRGLSSPDP